MFLTKSELKQKLSQSLPGITSHLKMAPGFRKTELLSNRFDQSKAKLSAVLILLFSENNRLKIAFIKRSEYDGVHSGQIAFPGGRFETTDADFEQTALRETFEEIGVPSNDIEIMGQLSDLYISPSNFLVKVFVGYCDRKPEFVIDRKEVQSVIEINIDDFRNSNAISEKEFFSTSNKFIISAPCYSVNQVDIWGATAMILTEFLDMLQ